MVLESSLSFAVAIHKLLVKNEACRLKGLHLFLEHGRWTGKNRPLHPVWTDYRGWNYPDESIYPGHETIQKELDAQRKTVFRSTLFPADKRLVKGSNMEELIAEIAYLIKL